ncbi:phage tail protein [Thiomicrorhabdus sp. Kp2]|uniref:gp53-like domain-containing protein n=1 Tax=Thiomicrorhabdus sp. Kp2 TaxID=1123518 RepID=UPI0004231C74|nr:phage tail protein [Thiomicrorhabdus sp. Kp2]
MSISLIITDAGRAEVINADNTGTGPVTLTEVALGTGIAASNPTQTALQAEFKRLTTISGLAVADDTIHVTVRDETNAEYSFSEFGIFTDSGTLFAVYSAPADIMQKAAASSLNMALDVVLGTLDANTVTFGDTNFANPPASETVSGVSKVATQTETNTGTDDTKFVTPKKLKAWVKQATESVIGMLKIATQAQTDAGIDDTVAVTPKKMRFGFLIQKALPGYIVFPSWLGGFIIQWSFIPFTSSAVQVWTYPISFPTACINVSGLMFNAGASPYLSIESAPTTANVSLRNSTGAVAINGYVIAFGY